MDDFPAFLSFERDLLSVRNPQQDAQLFPGLLLPSGNWFRRRQDFGIRIRMERLRRFPDRGVEGEVFVLERGRLAAGIPDPEVGALFAG